MVKLTNVFLLSVEWFNTSHPYFYLVIILGIFIIALLVYFIISFSYGKSVVHRYTTKIKNESNTLRIFSIDVKNGVVKYFDRVDMKNKKTINMSEFYNFFNATDVDKIKNWFADISSQKEDITPYLEVQSISDTDTELNFFSLLKLISFHKKQNVIHLEMQTLKYLSVNTSEKAKKKLISNTIVNMSTIKTIIENNKSLKGFTFSLRFTYVNQLAFAESEEERLMLLKIKNSVYPYAKDKKHPRYLCEVNASEILIFDLKLTDKKDAYQLALSLSNTIHKVMLLNDFSRYFKLTIGIVQNNKFYQDFNNIVKSAQEASFIAINENREICFYEKNVVKELNEEKNKELIDSLIRDDKIRYLFRPIVDVKGKKVLGYIESIKTYGASFSSYNEMMKYAHTCHKDRELFAVVAKNVIPRYADENPRPKSLLFFPVSILDFENIQTILPQITRIDKVHLVLIFEEQEISQTSSHLKELMNSLSTLKLLGYELALSMMDKNLLLDVNFYKIFDYFIAGTSMTGELKKNNLTRLSLRALIESLLKFKKPIIATGLEGWQSVELMVKSGVNFVSSEAISPSSEMILPVEKKKFEKLIDFIK